ncbi:putative methyltransferase tdiE [Hyphodiscus hymeniophilus]|uniref:Methyltransferase tdiE n=1 Tax=Hyphodiscus hymeniophilus TaxID=353542 RepID=A0A9P6SN83_9HELO|nr:putative methyltransferase tdiE [Hyphodiscus hymeniophilus]
MESSSDHATYAIDGSESLPSIDDGSDWTSADSNSMRTDSDSALGGSSLRSSTMSLQSSAYENLEENGRTYHRRGNYHLPNDDIEKDRLDLQHALFILTFHNNLYLAPIGDNPQRVLDLATRTGIWAIDFAQLHPSAAVIGTDLSPIQPEFVPPNCTFEIDDAEDEWTFRYKFDYIHGRALGTCFKDPGSVVAKAFDALQPGGYLELQDAIMPMQYVGEIPVSSFLYRWNCHVVESSTMAQRPWTNVKHYPEYFIAAGFEEIRAKKFFWPSNTWPKGEYLKHLSVYFQKDLMDGLEGLSMKLFTNFLGWTKEQVQEFLVGVRKDLQDRSIHAYIEISVVYGKKPDEPLEVHSD